MPTCTKDKGFVRVENFLPLPLPSLPLPPTPVGFQTSAQHYSSCITAKKSHFLGQKFKKIARPAAKLLYLEICIRSELVFQWTLTIMHHSRYVCN